MKYNELTDGLMVWVEPEYVGTKMIDGNLRYLWSYDITLENHSEGPLQLLNRHWAITDALGFVETVDGPGVVGQQPTLAPKSRFTYRSFCPLTTPSGFMGGHYEMLRLDDGGKFKATIPTFSLDSPDARPTIN